MGERGPAPKRSSQRRRSNSPEAETVKGSGVVRPPRADGSWHPVAKRWYQSLAKSGQSAFYEPSDWATAFMLAESMSRELQPQPLVVGSGKDARLEMVSLPPKGASLSAWLRAMTVLMVTEGDRRRLRLEVERGGEEAKADVSELDDYRARLAGGAS